MAKEKDAEKKPKVDWIKPESRAEVERAILKNLEGICIKGARARNKGWFPTGHFNLDFAISHGTLPVNVDLATLEDFNPREPGGIPRGRIIEIFGEPSGGKSSICHRIVGNAMKAKKVCAWMDREQSYVESLAELNGVNLDELFFIDKPELSAEECFDYIYALLESGTDIIVVDSVSGLIPKAVLEGTDSTKDTIALLARVMGKCIPKLSSVCAKTGGTVIFINQIRTKPGVCLRGDVMIPFADGTSMQIKDIVDQRISKNVWSFNEVTGHFESKPIVQWHDNGEVASRDEWVHIRTTGWGTRNGCKAITVTRDHKVFTERSGWTVAKDIQVGDHLLSPALRLLNGKSAEFMAAVMLGDSSLRRMGDNRATAQICFQDNIDADYAEWKASTLSPVLGAFTKVPIHLSNRKGVRHDSPFSNEMAEFLELHRDPMSIFGRYGLTPMMLAVWIMDDGYLGDHDRYTLSIKRMAGDEESLGDIADHIYDTFHLNSRVRARDGTLVFDVGSSKHLSSIIKKYVHPSMSRKLMPQDCGQFENIVLECTPIMGRTWEEVRSVSPVGASFDSGIKRKRYDIGVEGNHNYIAGSVSGGVLVHNCFGNPETTPGGDTLKFYSSLRIQITKKYGEGSEKYLEDENGELQLIAQDSYAYIRKNRFAKNLKNGIPIPIYFEAYFPDAEEVMFDFGRQIKLIDVRLGNYYWKYGSEKTDRVQGDGRKGFIDALGESGKLLNFLEALKNEAATQGVVLPPELMLYKPSDKKKIKKKDAIQSEESKAINEFLELDAASPQESLDSSKPDADKTVEQARAEADAIMASSGMEASAVVDSSEESKASLKSKKKK